MYGWYSALVPLFKKRIEQAKEVLSDSTKSTARDEVAAYGVWLERCKPEKLAAITVARATQAAVKGKDEDNSAYKISALSIAVGNDIEEYLDADSRARRDAFARVLGGRQPGGAFQPTTFEDIVSTREGRHTTRGTNKAWSLLLGALASICNPHRHRKGSTDREADIPQYGRLPPRSRLS